MATRSTRWLWILMLLLLLGLAAQWACNQNRRDSLLAQHAQEVQQLRADTERYTETWTGNLADRGAAALFHAFGAGIQPTVLAGRSEALVQAKNSLLQVRQVSAVHVLAPDGRVLVSSDDKYTTTGSSDERADWVFATTEPTTRPGERPGVIEVAGPIAGVEGPEAFLWVSIRRGQLLESTRPSGGTPPTPGEAAPATR